MAKYTTLDGNEAVASVAYRLSEVVAIYPITPASAMGEFSDDWAAAKRPNLWGVVPDVVEMQSEAGAAGAVHGALQAGSLATTFTASQGLLLMLPNLYKIAGELTGCAIHVAARAIATQALSIFGDHSDAMAARSTGFALLCSGSVQEAQDLAAIAHATALESRVPFLHFFDGFRTSHEVQKIVALEDEHLRSLIDPASIAAHRARRLTPEAPVLRGTSQNPDAFFPAREASNAFYDECPDKLDAVMKRFALVTGRSYAPFEYTGHAEPERVIVMMGSGGECAQEVLDALVAKGERVGLLRVRLFRPFRWDISSRRCRLRRAPWRCSIARKSLEPARIPSRSRWAERSCGRTRRARARRFRR
jgi:pyruvate-ferredoxin/flavodoxin oxidoreductase